MSETIEVKVPEEKESRDVSVEDLQRMLDESRGREEKREREFAQERAARLQAEQERDTAHGRVANEAEQRWEAQKRAFDGNISAADSDLERAKRDYKSAFEAGDATAAADAQAAIAAAVARADRFRAQKEYLESNKEQLVSRPREQPASDKYAHVIDVKNLLPAEREWLDRHPQFLNDTGYRQMVMGASQIAGARSQRGSEGYFREIERIIGEDADGPPPVPPPPPRSKASSDIAPQRRASPGASPANGREISLTADQVEVADALYGNPGGQNYIEDKGERYRRYHANIQRMKESGRL